MKELVGIIPMKLDKECKHSRRYAATDKESCIKTVYIDRKNSANSANVVLMVLLTNEEPTVDLMMKKVKELY